MKSPSESVQFELIRQLPNATAFVDEKLQVVCASKKWTDYFCLKTDTVIGTSISEFFIHTGPDYENSLNRCLSGSAKSATVNFNIDAISGSVCYEWHCVPWVDERQQIIGLIIYAEDVTERMRFATESKKFESLLKATSEIGKIGIWEYNFKNNRLSWCPMTRKIHEVSDDFKPTLENAVEFYKEGSSKNTIAKLIHEATTNGTIWSERLQIVTANGKEVWVQASGRPLYEDDKLVGFNGVFQNIDQQVKSEIKIKESENQLRTLVDNLPLNVYIKDTESRKILVNKSECKYLGVEDPNFLLGKTDFDFYDREVAEMSRKEDLNVMENRMPLLAKETTSLTKSGEVTSFLSSKIPLIDSNGETMGLIGISLDISNLKRKEAELRGIINVASLQNEKLTNFAHIVSHNLRSHSANFLMLLDFLHKEKDKTEKEKIIGMLTDAAKQLMEALENLNEVVAINTNVNLKKKSILLKNKIDYVAQNLSVYLKKNRAKLENLVQNTIKVKVVPAYIDSILMNFVTNAVKYKSCERDAEITLSAVSEKGYTILSIADNGLGIDLDKYGDKLFGMYKTFHNHSDARGIGLYMTKNHVEAMNGKITVESRLGAGTTFKIYFDENVT